MTFSDFALNLEAIMHITVLVVWSCLLLLADLWIPRNRKGLTGALAALGLAVTLFFTVRMAGQTTYAFNNMIVVDGFATFLNVVFLVSGLVGIALAYDYLKRMGIERGEYYVLLLFSIVGMMLMSHAADLIIVFLALELLSIPLYVLAGFAAPRAESEEASLKYFLLGAFSSSIVVYGVALAFGATGTTSLAGILAATNAGSANVFLILIGAALILVGMGFKVGVVPFHMWTPDVYVGSPSPVTAFMAVGAKVGGFAALLRIFVLAFPDLAADLTPVIWAIAALTMILGNLVAIAQSNIKRLLAYSSIAHAGYILMGLAPYGQAGVAQNGVAASLFYMVAYGLTNFAAWAVVIALEHSEDGTTGEITGLNLDDFAGLGRKYPVMAAVMAVAMISFTGVPPTLGFVGKFYLFGAVLEGGFIGLALIGVLTSLVSAYYYLRVVIVMYMRDGDPRLRLEPWLYATAVVAGAATFLLTFFAGPLFRWASEALFFLL